MFEGLKITIDGIEYNGQTRVSDYVNMVRGTGDYSVAVVIELPTTAANIYQGKQIAISYTVEAVQGNASTATAEPHVYKIYTAHDLALLRYFTDGISEIRLMNDIDMSGVNYTAWDLAIPSATTITFNGNNHTISNLTVTGYTGDPANSAHFVRSGLIARVYSADTRNVTYFGKIVFQNLTMENATVANTAQASEVCEAALVGAADFVNVEVNDCSVINSQIISGKYAAGLVGYAQEFADGVSISIKNATIKGNEIVGNGHTAGLVGLANKTVSVTGATIEDNVINTQLGHSAAATLGTGSVAATGIVANRNTYAAGFKSCTGETFDVLFGVYHKQLGDYTVAGNGADNKTYNKQYIITSLATLKSFRDLVNAGNSFLHDTLSGSATFESVRHNVLLLADIDLGNEEWTPIGTSAAPFKGDFDGMGHTISNLKITSGTNVGLFGHITMHAGVNYLPGVFNLTIKNATIKADGSGAFVGNANTTTHNAGNGGCLVLMNLKLTGDVKIEGKDVGGIIGTGWTEFQIIGNNITVAVNAGSYVKGTGTVGGVFASTPHGHINYITSNMPVYVSGADAAAGGIVGCAGWELGENGDNIDIADPENSDFSGSIICTGNVYATDITPSANGKYAIGKIVGSEANNSYWGYYRNSALGSFFRNFTATNSISIKLTNGTTLTSNGMTAADRHGSQNAVDYTQSLVGTAVWAWNF